MKKNGIIIMISIFLLVGCEKTYNTDTHISNVQPDKNISNIEVMVSEIPIDRVRGITSKEAVKICQDKIGERDDENFIYKMAEVHTGRSIGYRCDGAIEYNGKQYYIICMLWTGDDDDTWSTIGFLGVSSDGNEIYEMYERNDKYYLGDLITLTH